MVITIDKVQFLLELSTRGILLVHSLGTALFWVINLTVKSCQFSANFNTWKWTIKVPLHWCLQYDHHYLRCIDTNDEERDKGKTVEYGKAFFETEKKVFSLLLEAIQNISTALHDLGCARSQVIRSINDRGRFPGRLCHFDHFGA